MKNKNIISEFNKIIDEVKTISSDPYEICFYGTEEILKKYKDLIPQEMKKIKLPNEFSTKD